MQCIHHILFVFVFIFSSFTYAQPCSKQSGINDENEQQSITTPFLKDLEELGYCVIPQLFSHAETETLYQRVWHEFIEKAWPNCRMGDRSNWKETFPIHNRYGIFSGPAGQIQVMWDLRQDLRIVDVFAKIWNTDDLIVSMDGISVMCPPEIREGYFEPWPHVDQMVVRRQNNVSHNYTSPEGFISESSLSTKPYTIQGQFLFEDSFEGDGGFYCIPKSHLKFDDFAPILEAIEVKDISNDLKKNEREDCFREFFKEGVDESGNAYCWKHITAPKGSLILWDSRTVHWNQFRGREQPYRENPKVRMVGYLCYVPKTRLTNESRMIRIEAFEKQVSTGHNPICPELKYTKDHIRQGYEQYLEDSNYIQPKVNLSPLGESLLGL